MPSVWDTADIENAGEEENDCQDTSGHDVQKLKENISEKMQIEEKIADAPMPCPTGNIGQEFVAENRRPQGLKMAAGMAEKPVQKKSLKEKLEAFKRKAAGIEKLDMGKAKGKEEML